MTPEQREAAERLVADQSSSNLEWSRQVVDLLRELLAEPQGEPVAWCSLTPSGKIAYFDGKPMVMPGAVGNEVHRTPLYAHPPQQRKPLTHMQAVLLWGHRSDGPSTAEIVSFARAIEKAHGIVEEA